MKKAGKALIRFYKSSLNPLLPNSCIYVPSCSSYAFQAIEKHGLIKGCAMGFLRILRCNPFAKGGFDPVKENMKGRARWLV